MTERETPQAILQRLARATYYEILGVAPESTGPALQEAFHAFALAYHPDRYVHEHAGAIRLVTEVFKRGTEAFVILSDPKKRAIYDQGLANGLRRFSEAEAAVAKAAVPERERTLEDIARTPKAKQLALRADRCLVAGQVEKARIFLIDALQCDLENAELKARLDALYTADGFEAL